MKRYININCTICGNQYNMESYKYNRKIKHETVIGWYCSDICKTSEMARKLRYTHQEKKMMDKFGYRNVFQRKDVIKKIQSLRDEELITDKKKKTCISKYGVDNPQKVKMIKEKTIKTCIMKYGVHVAANEKSRLDEIRYNNVLKYGVKNYIESDDFKNKTKKTLFDKYGDEKYLKFGSISFKRMMMEKYGVENAMHVSEFAEKCQSATTKKSYQYKNYTLPSGKIIKLQGYENKTFNKLFTLGYSECDIKYKKSDMPEIWYYLNGVKRRYYPDFFVPKDNLIIETKSKYTYEVEREQNLKKFEATKQLGYNILTDIY